MHFIFTFFTPKLLSFGKIQTNLHIRSLNRNFGFAEVTRVREYKSEKLRLSLCIPLT